METTEKKPKKNTTKYMLAKSKCVCEFWLVLLVSFMRFVFVWFDAHFTLARFHFAFTAWLLLILSRISSGHFGEQQNIELSTFKGQVYAGVCTD